jgi:hypothetical protein
LAVFAESVAVVAISVAAFFGPAGTADAAATVVDPPLAEMARFGLSGSASGALFMRASGSVTSSQAA